MTATKASGADHPLNQPGAVRVLDLVGTSEAKFIEEFNTTINVFPVTRIKVTIEDTRDVPAVWEAGWSNTPLDQAPRRIGIKALDAVGNVWTRDWDGAYSDGPGLWIGPNGEHPTEARTNNAHLLRYTSRGEGYILVEV